MGNNCVHLVSFWSTSLCRITSTSTTHMAPINFTVKKSLFNDCENVLVFFFFQFFFSILLNTFFFVVEAQMFLFPPPSIPRVIESVQLSLPFFCLLQLSIKKKTQRKNQSLISFFKKISTLTKRIARSLQTFSDTFLLNFVTKKVVGLTYHFPSRL